MDTASKAFALGTALLPAVGAAVRFVSFLSLDGGSFPAVLAASAPLVVLFVEGLLSIGVFAGYLLLAFFYYRRIAPGIYAISRMKRYWELRRAFGIELDRLKAQAERAITDLEADSPAPDDLVSAVQKLEEQTKDLEKDASEIDHLLPDLPVAPRRSPFPAWVAPLFAGALLLSSVLLVRPWVVAIASPIAAALFATGMRRAARRGRRISLADVWPWLLTAYAIVAIGYGLSGNVLVAASTYQFDPSLSIIAKDDVYLELAKQDQRLFLYSCSGGVEGVVGVNERLILTSTSPLARSLWERLGPNLWSVFFRGAPLEFGVEVLCPP